MCRPRHLSQEIKKKDYQNIDAYEIDNSLENKSDSKINYTNFLLVNNTKKYDVIIGNPPYVRWRNIPEEFKSIFKNDKYWNNKINGLSDLLYAFIYKSVDLLKENGELIFITPSFWKDTLHSQHLRNYLLSRGYIELVIDFGEAKIFKNVANSIMIFKFVKNKKKNKKIRIMNFTQKITVETKHIDLIHNVQNKLKTQDHISEHNLEAFIRPQFENGEPWILVPPKIEAIFNSMEETCRKKAPIVVVSKGSERVAVKLSDLITKQWIKESGLDIEEFSEVYFNDEKYYYMKNNKFTSRNSRKLKRYTSLFDIVHIGNGLVSGLDKAFRIKDITKFHENEKEAMVKVVKAKNLRKYYHINYQQYIFLNNYNDIEEINAAFPNMISKLKEYKTKLLKRYNYGKKIPWWHWVFLRNFELMKENNEKIFCPLRERYNTKGQVRFAYVLGDYYATQDVTVLVKKKNIKEDLKYILALLNSKTIYTWLKYKGLQRGGVLEFCETPLTRIPIRYIDWDDPNEKKLHDRIVKHVDEIIAAKEYKQSEELEEIIKQLYGISNINLDKL